MKVCCFCEKWGSGGIESLLVNVLERMDRSEMQIHVVVSEVESDFYLPRLKACGIELRVLSGNTRRVFQNHVMFRRLLKAEGYDAVHLNIYHALSLWYGADAAARGVTVRIAHSHNAGLRKSFLRPMKLFINACARSFFGGTVTKRVACSADAAAFLFGGREWELLPNGIELERFVFSPEKRAVERRRLCLENRFVIGSVGRLCGQKNQLFLLDVMKYLLPMRPEAMLLLVGEGEDRPVLEARIAALGLSDSVVLYGLSDDVPGLMCAMDAFAMPSRFEGLGIVAIEAQGAGLFCLCSDAVPEEALATSLSRALPLEAELWAQALAALRGKERKSVQDELRRKGYALADTAARFYELWTK